MAKHKRSDLQKAAKVFGEHTSSYFESHVTNKLFIRELTKSAGLFRVNGYALGANIDEDNVYDLGGRSPNSSMIVSPVDLDQSEGLRSFLKETMPWFTSANGAVIYIKRQSVPISLLKVTKRPSFVVTDFLMVLGLNDDQILGVQILHQSGPTPVLFRPGENRPVEELGNAINKFVPPSQSVFMGLYDRVAVIKDFRWGTCSFTSTSVFPTARGRIEGISLSEASFRPYSAPVGGSHHSRKYIYSATGPKPGGLQVAGSTDEQGNWGGPYAGTVGGTLAPTGGYGQPTGGSLGFDDPSIVEVPDAPSGYLDQNVGTILFPCSDRGNPDACKGCLDTWYATGAGIIAGVVLSACLGTLGFGCAPAVIAGAIAAALLLGSYLLFLDLCNDVGRKTT